MKLNLKSVTTLLTVLTITASAGSPIVANAATWNGVSGVSDATVNSISSFQNQAASYDNDISMLTWQIQQNQGMVDTWTENLSHATNVNDPQHAIWAGREAQCQAAINNNKGPMLERIAKLNNLQNLKQQALNNAQNAKAQATAEAQSILNQKQASTAPDTSVPASASASVPAPESQSQSQSSSDSATSSPSNRSTASSESSSTSQSQSKDTNDQTTTETKPDSTTTSNESTTKTDTSSTTNTAIDGIINDTDKVKDGMNDYDHSKSVNQLISKNSDGSYSVSPEALKAEILNKINDYRKIYNLSTVKTSDALVDYAKAKAEDAKEQMDKGYSGHSNSQKSDDAYAKAISDLKSISPTTIFAKNDLAQFQSNFDTRKYDTIDDALASVNKIAEGIVGPYGGFLSDDHMYDILNPLAVFNNLSLTSKQEMYVDAWTGQQKPTTVWYLAYVYSVSQK